MKTVAVEVLSEDHPWHCVINVSKILFVANDKTLKNTTFVKLVDGTRLPVSAEDAQRVKNAMEKKPTTFFGEPRMTHTVSPTAEPEFAIPKRHQSSVLDLAASSRVEKNPFKFVLPDGDPFAEK